MGGIAVLAQEAGHRVSGSDHQVYPPMSTQLHARGIALIEGYTAPQFSPKPDCVVVGNALSRGNPAIEELLDVGVRYLSGPEWLAEYVLRDRWVIAVAGTHGKTTTSSMVAWILEYAGMQPGFLIGGIPGNFGISARLGASPFFVVEADEYDTAFFDKRSKFVHYRPRTAILNNLEFDHADIFPDVAAIQRQFHHLVRTVPRSGRLVVNAQDSRLAETLKMGCWSECEYFATLEHTHGWYAGDVSADGSAFDVAYNGRRQGRVTWALTGMHNVHNALAAIAAARHVGVTPDVAIQALAAFQGVKRRMEVRGVVNDVTVYDDFAHHPTAIATTLAGLRGRVGRARILAVMEPRSNTMKLGVHQATLAGAFANADQVFLYAPADLGWDVASAMTALGARVQTAQALDSLVHAVVQASAPGDHVVVMSNGGFGGFHDQLISALRERGEHG
jgi:UDP-N-acetylmuramate: L-alanyl-gamma-D-glutamyl-meso-diaminopimelate ligase